MSALDEALARLSEDFRAELPERVARLRDALEAARREPPASPQAAERGLAAQKLAHTLAGTAAQFQMLAVSRASGAIQIVLADADARGTQPDWEALIAAADALGE